MASGHSPPAWAALRMNRKYRPNATPAASPQATPPAAGRRPRPVEGRLSRLTSVTETRHSSAPAQRRDAEPLAVGNAHRDREQRGTQRGQRGHHADRSRGQPGEEHDHSHTADRTSGESPPESPGRDGTAGGQRGRQHDHRAYRSAGRQERQRRCPPRPDTAQEIGRAVQDCGGERKHCGHGASPFAVLTLPGRTPPRLAVRTPVPHRVAALFRPSSPRPCR